MRDVTRIIFYFLNFFLWYHKKCELLLLLVVNPLKMGSKMRPDCCQAVENHANYCAQQQRPDTGLLISQDVYLVACLKLSSTKIWVLQLLCKFLGFGQQRN